jgi:hypothetical protein
LLEWKDAKKKLGDMGNPGVEEDIILFYTATNILVGNEKKYVFLIFSFAWIAIQNRPWIINRLEKRG